MKYLCGITGNKSTVVYYNGKVAIASFPAKLNNYKIPELKDVQKLCK